MRRYFKFINIIKVTCIIVFFNGCSNRIMLYHSEAEIPYSSKTTLTKFELIKLDDKDNQYNSFGVIFANDNNKSKYLLLAPSNGNVNVTSIADLRLDCSITLLPNKTKYLLYNLEYSINNWNRKYPESQGLNVEYIVTTEDEVIKRSENVVSFNPILTYNYQNNSNGPKAVLIFGKGIYRFSYEFNDLEELKEFYELLKIGYNIIK